MAVSKYLISLFYFIRLYFLNAANHAIAGQVEDASAVSTRFAAWSNERRLFAPNGLLVTFGLFLHNHHVLPSTH